MLEVKDATIRVGERTLMESLSFTARDGQLTCVTGPSGCGKTALIRTLMGFIPVGEGFVSVDGELLTVRSARAFRKMMVYLPQQMHLLRRQLYDYDVPSCEAEEYGVWNSLLPEVSEEPVAESLTPDEIFLMARKALSEGADKPVVIADEPAAMLTPELSGQMLHLLQEQAAAGKTVLVASRRQEIIASSDLVINLNKG